MVENGAPDPGSEARPGLPVHLTAGPSRWAMAKVARAGQHWRELDGRMSLWAMTTEMGPRAAISDDRLSWEVRSRLSQPPPLSEWSLIAGDCLHNLRSALDVLVWAYAEGADQMPKRQQQHIAFPLVVEPDRWDEEAPRRLRGVPSDMVDRIRACQPFQHQTAQQRESDALRLLHDLDVRDKHRLALTTHIGMSGLAVDHGVEFHSDQAAARNIPPQVELLEAALEDDALVARGTTKDPIARIKGKLRLDFQVSLEVNGVHHKLNELLQGLAAAVEGVILYVVGPPDTVPADEPETG